ncbi:MAG TPA: hypothetical protein VGB59_08910 [Allosphingosinicella sp.]|jgi:hypothetical protein
MTLAAAFLLAGCQLDREALVLPVESGWKVEVAAGPADGFASPDGLMWRDGELLVADEGGSAVRVWTPGSRPRTLADQRAGLASPEDLATDAEGNLYFSDDTRGGIWRTDGKGGVTTVAAAARGLPSTEAIAMAPSGELLAGDALGHRVMKVARDGRVSVFLGPERGISKPESLAFDSGGNLYIADNQDDVLYLLTRDGKLHRTLAGQPGFSPESLHYAQGALFITDSRHGKLFRYTPEDGLQVIALFGGALRNVQGVTSDGRGTFYVSVQSDLKAQKGYILRLYRKTGSA